MNKLISAIWLVALLAGALIGYQGYYQFFFLIFLLVPLALFFFTPKDEAAKSTARKEQEKKNQQLLTLTGFVLVLGVLIGFFAKYYI
ncbi:hypothetical protein [Lacticigenium naphthae]|uniref:hypothetical protein n=1 Tax=Lacticigenium naphthae TaxID=515351 RepID=UPI000418B353|nr:hypothetical protein [Lacticigenium naphthae]